MVRVKKNATNVPQQHLKPWWHVRRFSSTVCATMPCRSAPSCKAPQFKDCGAVPFAVKMQCSPNYGAFGKNCRNLYPGASNTNPEGNHKSVAHFLIKKWCTNFTNCCILFDAYRTYMHTCMVVDILNLSIVYTVLDIKRVENSFFH